MTSSHPFQTNATGCWRSGADPEIEKEGVHGGAADCCAPSE